MRLESGHYRSGTRWTRASRPRFLLVAAAVAMFALAASSPTSSTVNGSHVTGRASSSLGAAAGGMAAKADGFARLPLAARATVSRVLGRDLRAFRVRASGAGVAAFNRGQGLSAQFDARGVQVHAAGQVLSLELRAWGYGGSRQAAVPVAPRARGNRVFYRRGSLTEWYANGPLGLEQGFTLATPPAGRRSGPLTLTLALAGNAGAALASDREGLSFAGSALRYQGLAASDARGHALRAWLELRGASLLIRVEDAGARYPLTIDPLIQLAKLTASDGTSIDKLGYSVAVSGDTIVAGAIQPVFPGRGAVYVFVRPAAGWASGTETAKLTASDGAALDYLGSSVAVSGDTIVAGADSLGSAGHKAPGAVYVFVKPAAGWASGTETAKLTASDGASGDLLGSSVAVSGDTIVAGAPFATAGHGAQGAAYVFVKPAAGWASGTETAKLTASDGGAGDRLGSVAVSGHTIVAGAYLATVAGHKAQGTVYVFVKPAAGWASGTETAKLTASDGAPLDGLGFSVAVAGDTIVAGATGKTVGGNNYQGAAYVFIKPATGWASGTETAKLTASDGASGDVLGYSVAVSGDAIVAGATDKTVGGNDYQGAAYVFLKAAAGWASGTETAKLTASDGRASDLLGYWVAVSGDTIVAGAIENTVVGNVGVIRPGAVYVFGTAPSTALKLTLGGASTQRLLAQQAITVTASCNRPCSLAATGSARILGTRYVFRLTGASASLAAAGTKTLRLRFPAAAQKRFHRLLKPGQQARAVIKVKAADTAGRTSSKTRIVVVR